MLSLQQLPFEVLLAITKHLEQQDKYTCLALCKAIYQPSLESLYQHVEIMTLAKFRFFLVSITHHRHQPNLHVKRLDLTLNEWYNNDGKQQRSMTFTEFELLARYLPNLTQILFYGYENWRFMSKLDLKKYWPHLSKIPTMSSFNQFKFINVWLINLWNSMLQVLVYHLVRY
jgi:hypothetical protein